MRERVVTVPKDKEAQKFLDLNSASKSQLLEYYLSEDEFSILFNANIFDIINRLGGINVDDFEDENLLDLTKNKEIQTALNEECLNLDSKTIKLIRVVIFFFEEAFIRGTGVYFYF